MIKFSQNIQLGAFGSPFLDELSSCRGLAPKHFNWVFNKVPNSSICVVMDNDILRGVSIEADHKYLWLCESKAIVPNVYEYVKNNYAFLANVYKKIFTHDESLLQLDEIFTYNPPASNKYWVKDLRPKAKTQLINMISSGKSVCEGHMFRNSIANFISRNYSEVMIYGREFRPVEEKEDVLSNVMFSIAIENCQYDTYYTEKLMDCFVTKSIPIYFGSRTIDRWFNEEGIIRIDEQEGIRCIERVSPDLYYSKLDAIEDNFERALIHKMADDHLYESILSTL